MRRLLRGKIESAHYVRKWTRTVCHLSLRCWPLPLHDVCIFLYSKIESISHRNSDIYNPGICHLMDEKNG
ncbi:hypothetical protein A6J81_08840 [Citrobacter braakii]|nr:hypothetical protein A6J81_08840 [Citrobacter braakii]ATX02281.1 hypothetical protein CU079_11930 [Citrobacter freundii]AUT97846.1 hypothetical protein MC47_022265 [Citrobacter freundii]ROW38298.1 hypothetical protein C3454_02755 [Citrobacter europaeus]